MAVYHDAKCRLCRREGMKLFLKGQRGRSAKRLFRIDLHEPREIHERE